MKKISVFIFAILFLFGLSGCNGEKQEVVITIPAGSMESFVFSKEVFEATSDKIIINAGAGYADTSVTIKTEKINDDGMYEPVYLTHGMPVEIEVKEGEWFKIGISVQNIQSNHDIAVSVYVQNVETVS